VDIGLTFGGMIIIFTVNGSWLIKAQINGSFRLRLGVSVRQFKPFDRDWMTKIWLKDWDYCHPFDLKPPL